MAALLLLAVVTTGCGRRPVLRLSDYGWHQRDQVTTRFVPAHSELAKRLLDDGWRFDGGETGTSAFRLVHRKGRIWFYSSGGRPLAAELYLSSPREKARRLFYELNGSDRRAAPVRRGQDTLRLDLRFETARPGWNALDLITSAPLNAEDALSFRGLRLFDRATGRVGDEGPRAVQVVDGDLHMPGESRLEAVFRAPDAARLKGRVSHGGEGSDPLTVAIELTAGRTVVSERTLELTAGDRQLLDIDLADWAGQMLELSIQIEGSRSASAVWRTAGIFGEGRRRAVEASIRPALPPRSGRLGRPDVLIVVLDAARADAFGTYGAEHPTPNVDQLAAAGTRFDRATSPSSWTGQSIPPLISGFLPDTLHTERWGDPLPDAAPHVAELMAGAGYRTVLWSQHPIYNRSDSLKRGFEHTHYNGRKKRSQLPNPRVLFERNRPTFALIHLLPPHSPYRPPPPFRGSLSADYTGPLPEKLGAISNLGRRRALDLSEEDRAYVLDRYLENVAYADWLVGRMLKIVQRRKRFANALIIVTSDHGEAFFEHGRFMHSRELYQEFVRIPLVVKWPDGARGFAADVIDPVSLIDILPTLVDGVDLDGAAGGFQGRSLLPTVFDGVGLERATYAFTRGHGDVHRLPQPRRSFEEGSYRVLHDPVEGRTELYHVTEDPGEQTDLAVAQPTLTRYLLQQLRIQKWFNVSLFGLEGRADVELDPEMVEELKALGYL